MTGSGLDVILIPIAGTIFLVTWLVLVFYAGGHLRRADDPARPARPAHPRPAHPGRLTSIPGGPAESSSDALRRR